MTASDDAGAEAALGTRAPLTKRQLWWALAGLLATTALAALDNFIVNPALPRIVGEFGGMAHLSWVMTAFMLASTITMPLYGKFSDIYGRRLLFSISIALFLLGSALCGAAQSMLQLIVFRGVQGLGAGGAQVLAMTAMGDLVSPRDRPRYQGLFNAVFAMSSIAGPVVGGAVTQLLGWRWVFYINIPVGAVALALIWSAFPDASAGRGQRPKMHRIDWQGVVLLAIGTIAFLSLTQLGEHPEKFFSLEALLYAVLAIGGFALLVPVEKRAAEPILAVHLAGNRVIVQTILTSAAIGLAFFGSSVYFPLYFQMVDGHSAASSGLMLLPQLLAGTSASIVSGHYVSRTGRYKPTMMLGIFLVSAAFFGLTATAVFGLGDVAAMACLFCMGCGGGTCMPMMTVALQNATPQKDLGVGTSSLQFCNQLAAVAGVAISGLLLTRHARMEASALLPPELVDQVLSHGVQTLARLGGAQREMVIEIYRHAFTTTFLTSAVLTLLSLILSLRIPAIRLREDTHVPEQGEGALVP